MNTLRSPLPWIGGTYSSAPRILQAFPHHTNYDLSIDLFGEAAHVLLQNPAYHHAEAPSLWEESEEVRA